MVPLEFKNLNDVEMFNFEIRKWEPRPAMQMQMQIMSTICAQYRLCECQ